MPVINLSFDLFLSFFVDFKIEELYYVEIEYEKYVWIKICRTLRD